ncbi:hypothetical protein EV363DRAFT_1169699 [Boletus edulis]|uniref:GmrSD restriction endonucleases N-terminal domain-containing protein n=1 Tax=Boletus edulis BED1 TaxID=1328754 RepID=A0AAD4C880_BOLED|nr:hypothetical protein EV363DRAFT_1169699 [Boletus edulis]KAF8452251.1 hypothetical protein L210DRAFT_1000980 [Boletus edulis BED1]
MSLSDISDLTDLSTDVDEPLAKRTSKAKKAVKEYKITNVLRAPRTAQYTAKSLYDQIIDNSIDLDPDYQRDIVWQEEKQSGLIDSLLRNYYIPPIIFAVTAQEDGSELRTCIDGKQRLTSIQRFVDGQSIHKLNTCLHRFTNEKLWFKSSATNTRRKLLPQYLKTQFTNKQIVCVEYTGLDNDQEREIFQASKQSPTPFTVQLGVALTPAERLQALVSPWSTVIHDIQHQVLGEEGFEGYLDWGHARGRDFQCLATIGYLIENHPKTTVPGTKALERWLQKAEPVSAQLRADLHETFRIFVTLARDKKYSGSLNRPTRVAPIEFVMIGVLIYLKRQSLSLTQISSAIEKMRKDVRASHQDIRSNTRVTKHLMEFMAKKIKVSELKSDGDGDKPAAVATAQATKSAKRKRPVYSDDSDTEPTPKVKSTKRPAGSTAAEGWSTLFSRKCLLTTDCNQATKSSKQVSGGDQKISSEKKVATVPKPQVTKPWQPSMSSRTTNNSLSNLSPVPPKKTHLPPLAVQTSRSRAPPPQPSTTTTNGHNAPSRSTTSASARHTPLTVQTCSTMKVESPQMVSVNSPSTLSAVDRLAPIRAAKASLASGTNVQSLPGSNASDMRPIPSPSANTPQTPLNYLNPAVPQPAPYQTTLVSQQAPPPPPVQPSSQHIPAHPRQGGPIPPQLQTVLKSLHSQFPQLGLRSPNSSNGAVTPAQNAQANGIATHHAMPPPAPGLVNTGSTNNPGYASQTYSVGTSQGTYDGNTTGAQANSKQTSRNAPIPIPVGPHALPQRPAALAGAPNNSMRAEPLGPPPRSTSSDRVTLDGRRGPYDNDRRYSDDRRINRHDRSRDNDRGKRNRFRSRN